MRGTNCTVSNKNSVMLHICSILLIVYVWFTYTETLTRIKMLRVCFCTRYTVYFCACYCVFHIFFANTVTLFSCMRCGWRLRHCITLYSKYGSVLQSYQNSRRDLPVLFFSFDVEQFNKFALSCSFLIKLIWVRSCAMYTAASRVTCPRSF